MNQPGAGAPHETQPEAQEPVEGVVPLVGPFQKTGRTLQHRPFLPARRVLGVFRKAALGADEAVLLFVVHVVGEGAREDATRLRGRRHHEEQLCGSGVAVGRWYSAKQVSSTVAGEQR